jgi:hypothetical protein
MLSIVLKWLRLVLPWIRLNHKGAENGSGDNKSLINKALAWHFLLLSKPLSLFLSPAHKVLFSFASPFANSMIVMVQVGKQIVADDCGLEMISHFNWKGLWY